MAGWATKLGVIGRLVICAGGPIPRRFLRAKHSHSRYAHCAGHVHGTAIIANQKIAARQHPHELGQRKLHITNDRRVNSSLLVFLIRPKEPQNLDILAAPQSPSDLSKVFVAPLPQGNPGTWMNPDHKLIFRNTKFTATRPSKFLLLFS